MDQNGPGDAAISTGSSSAQNAVGKAEPCTRSLGKCLDEHISELQSPQAGPLIRILKDNKEIRDIFDSYLENSGNARKFQAKRDRTINRILWLISIVVVIGILFPIVAPFIDNWVDKGLPMRKLMSHWVTKLGVVALATFTCVVLWKLPSTRNVLLSGTRKFLFCALLMALLLMNLLYCGPSDVGFTLSDRLAHILLPIMYFALVVSILSAWWIAREKYEEQWKNAREKAEVLRQVLFNRVMEAPADRHDNELPVFDLKFEYFRRYQLDVQTCYHQLRSAEFSNALTISKWLLNIVAFFAIVFVISILMVFIASLSEQHYNTPDGLSPSWLLEYERLGTDAFGFFVAGIFALILGIIFQITTIGNHKRNAARLKAMQQYFEHLNQDELPRARASIAEGKETKVMEFITKVHFVMAAERDDWVRLKDLDLGIETRTYDRS